MKKFFYLLCCLFSFDLTAQSAIRLDTGFGQSGFSVLDQNPMESLVCTAVQPDGKIVAAGYSGDGKRSKLIVVRYLSNGNLDNTFGQNGVYLGSVPNALSNTATALTLQADGKILVAGYYQIPLAATNNYRENMFITRLTSQGTLETGFGFSGYMTLDQGRNERPSAITVGLNNRIYVLGSAFRGTASDIFLMAYKQNGAPESTFGVGGYLKLIIAGTTWSQAFDMEYQPDGKIILVGESRQSSSLSNMLLMRLLPNGSPDINFSGDGLVVNTLGNKDDVAYCVKSLPDGSVLMGGYTVASDGKNNMVLLKYKSNGAIDSDFGVSGKSITTLPEGFGQIAAMGITPAGNIVVAGSARRECTHFDWVVCRFTSSGTLLKDTGEEGFLYVDFGEHYDGVSDAELLPDGKFYVVGSVVNPANSVSELLLARFQVDLSVGTDEPEAAANTFRIFPNPTQDGNITLQYHLNTPGDIQVDLFSVNGQFLGTLLKTYAPEGPQQSRVALPDGLAKGCYLTRISTATDRSFVKLILQ